MSNLDLGVPLKFKLGDLKGIISSQDIFKIIDGVKKGKIPLGNTGFDIVGYTVHSTNVIDSLELTILPNKDIKMDDILSNIES